MLNITQSAIASYIRNKLKKRVSAVIKPPKIEVNTEIAVQTITIAIESADTIIPTLPSLFLSAIAAEDNIIPNTPEPRVRIARTVETSVTIGMINAEAIFTMTDTKSRIMVMIIEMIRAKLIKDVNKANIPAVDEREANIVPKITIRINPAPESRNKILTKAAAIVSITLIELAATNPSPKIAGSTMPSIAEIMVDALFFCVDCSLTKSSSEPHALQTVELSAYCAPHF